MPREAHQHIYVLVLRGVPLQYRERAPSTGCALVLLVMHHEASEHVLLLYVNRCTLLMMHPQHVQLVIRAAAVQGV